MLRKIIGLGRIRPEQAASDEDEESEDLDAYDGAEEQDEATMRTRRKQRLGSIGYDAS